ncbi:MAG: hypothetical protein K2L37_00315, partial [Lactobacillus sp.]|nr:hypothetical protein [Lactobacillus sp.]
MLATGDNANGSEITLESVKKAMDRGEFYNKPVVAHLYQDPDDNNKWRVGGHDSKWVITRDSFDIVNECIPYGTIPESSDLKLEEVLEPDGVTVNTYLTCQLILWSGRFNIMDATYDDDIYFNQSCELSVNEYHWKDNDVLAIDDFTFSALCLLNKSNDAIRNVRPCFPSCRVERIKSFSIDESKFKQNFELMLRKLKQYESDVATTQSVQNNITTNTKKKGANDMDFAKIIEILSAKKCSENDSISQYRLLDVTESKVFALDVENYKPYSFNYAIAKDAEAENEYVVIDFESIAEMSLSARDKLAEGTFDEFIIKDAIDAAVKNFEKQNEAENNKKIKDVSEELSKEFETEYQKLNEDYQAAIRAMNILQSKVDAYEKADNEAKIEQHKRDIDSLVNGYAEKLSKCSAYLVYKANIEKQYEKDYEQVEQDLILMAGKFLTSKDNPSGRKYSYNPTETGVVNRASEAIANRYGTLLD